VNRDATTVVQILAEALLLSALSGITLYYLSVPSTEILLANGKTEVYSPNITDAVWFTVQTMTTTGYGSLPLEVWNPKLKWASVVLMLCAAALWTFLLGLVVNLASMRLMHGAGNPGN
jgi:hypothetical protein